MKNKRTAFARLLRTRAGVILQSATLSIGCRRHGPFICLLALLLGFAGNAEAAVRIWTGLGGSGNWSTAANWDTGSPINNDSVVFNNGTANGTTTNNVIGRTLSSITFAGSGTGISLRGNAITLTGGISASQTIVDAQIYFDITLATNNQTFSVSGPAALVIGGNINLNGLNLSVNATAVTNAVILNGAISGTGNVIKNSGPGTLYLLGSTPNTFNGLTTINTGVIFSGKDPGVTAMPGDVIIGNGSAATLHLANDNQTAPTANIFIRSGGLFDLNGASNAVANITFVDGGSIQTVAFDPGMLTLGGNVTLNGAATSASISGNLNLGTSSKVFTVTNPASTLGISASIGGGNSGAPFFIAGGVTKNGLGNLTLSGSNTFAGPVTVNDGTLQVNNNYALGTTGAVSINHDPTTIVNSNAVLLLNNAHITNEVLTLNSINTNGALQDNLTGDWTGPIALNTNVYIEASSLLQLNGAITGPGGFTKISASTLALTGNNVNTYAGTTTVNNGTLLLSRTAGIGATIPGPLVINSGTVRLGADAQIYSLGKSVTMADATLFDLNGHTDLIGLLDMTGAQITTGTGYLYLGDAINVNGSSVALSQISGSVLLANGTETITCADGDYSPDLEISANISGSGGAGIIKNGIGEVSLSGTNTYTGSTTVNDGYLWATNTYAFGNTNTMATVNSGGAIFLYGNVAIGAKPLTINGNGGVFNHGALNAAFGASSWAGDITLGSSSTIGDNLAASSLTLNGKIMGVGALTLKGPGTITLSGSTANTYIGNTIVTNGTLMLSKTVANQTITGNLIVYGTVRLGNDDQVTDSADVLINGGGVFDTGVNMERINTLHGNGSVTLGIDGWIEIGLSNGSSTFDGIISGTGYTLGGYSVAKKGTGSFTLNGNNTFTAGAFKSFAGQLLVNGSQPQVPVIVNSGSSFGGSGTVGTISASGVIAPGNSPGTLTSSNITFFATGTLAVELTGPTAGTGYDQLNVRGTNSLANSTLQVIPNFISPATIGQQFTILNNDGIDAVTGTFNGLPQGATVSVGGNKFTISYTGGTGNDVVLTLVDVPGAEVSASIASGDGSHTIDPNECNSLNLVITNKSGALMTGINATLSTTTPGVIVSQPYSTYANLAVNGNGTNATGFQISTLPSFICGTDISFQLIVDYSAGSFVTSFTLHTGGAASSPLRFDNNVSTAIPDVGTLNSTNIVAGFTGPLEKVTVSLYLTHTFDSDLNLSLVSPDGTIVPLTIGIGTGADFGSGSADSSRTTFDDAATTLITASSSPFVGTFRPQTTLAALTYNGTPNGSWKLRVTDNFGGSLGTLRNWSLFLYPVACNNGGGVCDPCLSVISNSITGADLIQAGRWIANSVTASCGAPKVWPGLTAGAYHYDIYTFTNTSGADACVTVQLQSSSNLMATAYLNSFNAGNISTNYAGDAGDSTHGDTTTFSSTVTNGGTLLVTVNEVTSSANPQPYTLTLYGLPCPPPSLAIAKVAPANSVRVHWPTWAGGYQLEGIASLAKTNWVAITNEPLVNLGRFNVTNAMNATNQFYRLHKP